MSENIVPISTQDLIICPLNVRALYILDLRERVKNNQCEKWEKDLLADFDLRVSSLAKTMLNYKTIIPLIVRESIDEVGKYEVVSGERRRQAAEVKRIQELPCIIRTMDDDESIKLIAVEDEQREDLNFYQKGKLIEWMKDGKSPSVTSQTVQPRTASGTFGKIGKMSFKEIADMLGHDTEDKVTARYYIAKDLPEELELMCQEPVGLKVIDRKRLTVSKAYALAMANIPKDEKLYLASLVDSQGLAVPELRSAIKERNLIAGKIQGLLRESLRNFLWHEYFEPLASGMFQVYHTNQADVQEQIDKALGRPVSINPLDLKNEMRKKLVGTVKYFKGQGAQADAKETIHTKTNVWTGEFKWEFDFTDPRELQRMIMLAGAKFSTFEQADEWAELKGGYCNTKEPVKTGKGPVWTLFVKESKLTEEDKKEIL